MDNFYKDKLPDPDKYYLLRCGFGSGQLSTSILLKYKNLTKDDSKLKNGRSYKNGNDPYFNYEYPVSTKTICMSDNTEIPIGWIKINKSCFK